MKKIVVLFCSALISVFAFAAEKNPLLSEFYKGNLQNKITVVSKAASSGNSQVILKALDFLVFAYDSLGDDAEFESLAETVIKSLTPKVFEGNEKNISGQLFQLFKISSGNKIKIAVIDSFYSLPGSDAVTLINDYFYRQMQNRGKFDESVSKSVEFMGIKGNSASFNRLFIADILEIWPEQSSFISENYAKLAEENRREILQMIVSVPADKKILVLKKLNENDKISKKIRGECAENVLSSIINKEEGNSKDSREDLITLELLCLDTIAQSKWTRASSLSTKCFDRIRYEYEQNLLSTEQFTGAIGNIASVAASDTVLVLSSYLDYLNKCAENGQTPVKDVVLSVINSLGDLGDNRAFDFIYAATSLDYPEEIVEAAKSAIKKLKW